MSHYQQMLNMIATVQGPMPCNTNGEVIAALRGTFPFVLNYIHVKTTGVYFCFGHAGQYLGVHVIEGDK